MSYDRPAAEEKEGGLRGGQQSLADRTARWTADRNRLDTPVQGQSLHRWETPTGPEGYMLSPSVCLIGQGRKRLVLGEEAYIYDAHRFLITSVDLPVVAQIIEASADKPYRGLTMELDLRAIAQLMLNDERPPGRASNDRLGVAVSTLSAPLLDAFNRLLELLEQAGDITALGPLVQQEIFYRLLTGEQGPRLRQIASAGNHGFQRSRLDPAHYAELVAACAARRHLFTPEREQAGWGKFLEDTRTTGAVWFCGKALIGRSNELPDKLAYPVCTRQPRSTVLGAEVRRRLRRITRPVVRLSSRAAWCAATQSRFGSGATL